jgi:hypothetical protein
MVLAKIAKEDPEAPHSAIVSAVKELNAMHGFNEPSKVDIGVKGIARIVVEGVDRSPD